MRAEKKNHAPVGLGASKAISMDGADDVGASASFINTPLMQVMDALPHYVLLIDEHHHIVLANKATREALGVTPEEIIGGYCPQVVHGVSEYAKCPISEAVKKDAAVEYEVFNKKIGRWFKTCAYPTDWRSADGGRIYYHTIQDIHDAKSAEEATLREKKLSDSIVSNMPAGIAFLDRDFVLRKTNDTYAGFIHKYSPQVDSDIIGKSYFELMPGSRSQLESWFHQVRDTGEAETRMEFELTLNNGGKMRKTFWNTSITPAHDKNGEIDGIIVLSNDLTEHRVLEEQLIKAQKMESVGRLASGVAHDFNNLLTAIVGYTEIAMESPAADGHQKDSLREVLGASNRAADLTRQLLYFSHNEPVNSKPVNLKKTVVNLQKMLERIIGENYNLQTELPDDLWVVLADTTQIEQVIMNLVVNARDAMPDGGDIVITAENTVLDEETAIEHPSARSGKFVCLTVADRGTGINKETIDNIFEPFFTTKGPTEGTGLGLSVVYGIISQHKGWIDVDSTQGLGTRFMVCLPVTAEQEEIESREKDPVVFAGTPGRKVLLVEDEDVVRKLMEKILSDCGYDVTVASDAKTASEIFNNENGGFDLLLSDITLPGENGVIFANRLKKLKPSLPVVLASGYNSAQGSLAHINGNGYSMLQKPFTRNQLLKTIKDTLADD